MTYVGVYGHIWVYMGGWVGVWWVLPCVNDSSLTGTADEKSAINILGSSSEFNRMLDVLMSLCRMPRRCKVATLVMSYGGESGKERGKGSLCEGMRERGKERGNVSERRRDKGMSSVACQHTSIG